MRLVAPGTDRYEAVVTADVPGAWTFQIEAWGDPLESWRHDARIKIPEGQDVELMLEDEQDEERRNDDFNQQMMLQEQEQQQTQDMVNQENATAAQEAQQAEQQAIDEQNGANAMSQPSN